jgi:hypothetical protein
MQAAKNPLLHQKLYNKHFTSCKHIYPATAELSGARQRPSLAQVAARAADEQQKTDQSGKDGKHADAAHYAGFAYLQADPIVAVVGVGRVHADDPRQVYPRAILDAHRIAALCTRERSEPVGCRRDFIELAGIGWTDIGKRGELAVARAPKTKLFRLESGSPDSRLGLVERQRSRLA